MEKQFLIVLGGGGHTEQMLKLVENFNRNYQISYVIKKKDKITVNRIKTPGKIYYMSNPREMEDKNIIKVILKMIPSSLDAIKILLKAKPHYIISCGPAISLPILFLGKIFRKKIIFIESWSRIYSKSLSGRIAYCFSDLFFVQWKELKKSYPKAIYAGRLG
jgi:beta-1,4-N-acetylglucosaminyltransferase